MFSLFFARFCLTTYWVKNTHARVKKQDEKYGVKNTKWPEVCVFTVFCKVLSDHILPRVTNTHARVKNTG